MSPLFEYSFDGQSHEASLNQLNLPPQIIRRAPPNPGDLVPVAFHLPEGSKLFRDSTPVALTSRLLVTGIPINHVDDSPFNRSTLIIRVVLLPLRTASTCASPPTTPILRILILKLQWAVAERAARESQILEYLWNPLPSPPQQLPSLPFPPSSPPTYAPRLHASFSCSGMNFQTVQGQHSSRIHRHLEILLLETPLAAVPLSKLPTPAAFLAAVTQTVYALRHASLRHVQHRDVSSGNVLATPDGTVVLIDWDCGAIISTDSSKAADHSRSGTIDTMSCGVLYAISKGRPFTHELRHDVESLAYLILKTLMQRAVVNDEMSLGWIKAVKSFRWDILSDPGDLISHRVAIWTDSSDLKGNVYGLVDDLEILGAVGWTSLIREICKLGRYNFGALGNKLDSAAGGVMIAELVNVLLNATLEEEVWGVAEQKVAEGRE